MTGLLILFVVPLAILFSPKHLGVRLSQILSLVPALLLVTHTTPALHTLFSIPGGGTLTLHMGATPLGLFFAWMVAVAFPLLMATAYRYTHTKQYHALFHLLTASLFVILFACDMILFFVGWEMMTWSAYLLMIDAKTMQPSVMMRYILYAIASAMALLGGIVLLSVGAKSLLFSDMAHAFIQAPLAKEIAVTLLFSIAFLIKSGAIGLHGWVVRSYALTGDLFAPFPSAVLSKMGIYGLLIFFMVIAPEGPIHAKIFANKEFLSYLFIALGVATSIIGTFKAIEQDSIKRLLAYSSIAQLGYIVAALATFSQVGVAGVLYHSLIHTAVKLLLFINAAAIFYATGHRRFSQLGGLIYKMPFSFVALLIGIIALAGIPPLGGFSSKYLIYHALLDTKYLILLALMMFSSAAAFIYCYKLVYGIYLGHPSSVAAKRAKEVPMAWLIPQYLISIVLVALGAFPGLLNGAIEAVLGDLGLPALPAASASTLALPTGAFNGTLVMGLFILASSLKRSFIES